MANDKHISASDLIKAIRDDLEIDGRAFARVKKHIEDAPAVEAVHGRWIARNKGQNNWVMCSVCNTVGSPFWKCCPVCEAKMDLPQITEQTTDALMKMGENAHGEVG